MIFNHTILLLKLNFIPDACKLWMAGELNLRSDLPLTFYEEKLRELEKKIS
jgi:hypothetical protein